MRNPIAVYRRLLHQRPFVTNVLTSCAFMTAGDIISQCLLQEKQRHDWSQTSRFALAGLVFVGPAVRGLLVTIERLFGPTTSLAVLGKKVFFDQVLVAPWFLACNMSLLKFLETRSLERVANELGAKYTSVLRLNYTFWPFVSLMNFYFVPLAYRVIFASTAALIWNTLFSFKLNYQRAPLEPKGAES